MHSAKLLTEIPAMQPAANPASVANLKKLFILRNTMPATSISELSYALNECDYKVISYNWIAATKVIIVKHPMTSIKLRYLVIFIVIIRILTD